MQRDDGGIARGSGELAATGGDRPRREVTVPSNNLSDTDNRARTDRDGRPAPWASYEPLAADRARIERIRDRLEETADPTERADLAGELVRAVSRYEDTVERAVFSPGALPEAASRELDDGRRSLREAMDVIHQRTLHVTPRNVYAEDPAGFEQCLETVLRLVHEHLLVEDDAFARIVADATGEDRHRLAEAVADAAGNASERPHPPRTGVGRLLGNAHVKLDRAVEDVSTPQHPGAGTVDD